MSQQVRSGQRGITEEKKPGWAIENDAVAGKRFKQGALGGKVSGATLTGSHENEGPGEGPFGKRELLNHPYQRGARPIRINPIKPLSREMNEEKKTRDENPPYRKEA